MKGKFEFKDEYTYHMPVHFRGMPTSEAPHRAAFENS